MGERNWSLSVLADKSLLLWAVIGIIFPFKVGTEMHFAEISCESLHAGRLIFPQDRMWIIYPAFSTMLPALSLTCTHSLTHTNQTQAANLAWLSEQKQQNDPDLFVLWACSFGAGHHVGPCFQGNHWDAEHILCYPTLQDALGIFFFPPLRICWRHQSEIICRTWLALISIYKYVILPRSRGDYLNLGWNELQEIHGTAN